jgi:TRAP-type C4-dicarboxylate transport system substrate-binding protein
MRRFSVIISLLVALVLIVGVVGCSQTPAPTTTAPTTQAPSPTAPAAATTSAPAPTTSKPATTAPATTSAPSTTPASTTATAKFVFSLAPISVAAPPPEGSNPPPAGASLFFSNYAKMAATKTNGQVKIENYFAQTISPANQIVNSTSTGVADIGACAQDKEPGKLPLSMVTMQPGFGTDWWAQCTAFWDLMNQEPLLSEFTKYNLLPLGNVFVSDYYIISTKPLRTIADIKGKKISVTGVQADTLTALGAVPVAMGPPEQYEGMQKGTIDGNAAGFSPIADFKFYEVAKNINLYPLGGKLHPILINKNSWNKLPADIQATFKAMIPDMINMCVDCYYRQGQPLFPMSEQIIKANNIEIVKPSAEDIAALQKVQAG